MLLWFVCLAILGVGSVIQSPRILESFSPTLRDSVIRRAPMAGLRGLGECLPCLNGRRSLICRYGHFGKGPIRLGWYTIVLPSLLLQYLGRGRSCSGSRTL